MSEEKEVNVNDGGTAFIQTIIFMSEEKRRLIDLLETMDIEKDGNFHFGCLEVVQWFLEEVKQTSVLDEIISNGISKVKEHRETLKKAKDGFNFINGNWQKTCLLEGRVFMFEMLLRSLKC